MAAPDFRHQLHLHRAQVGRFFFLLLAALLLALSAQAQKKSLTKAKRGRHGQIKSVTTNNAPGYDDKWFHPGFYIAGNSSGYRIRRSQDYINSQGGRLGVTANEIGSAGFSVGFIGDVRLVDYLSFRFAPGVSFLTRRVEFEASGYQPDPTQINDPAEIVTQEIATTQLDLPLLFKFHSDRRRNTRVYLIGGVRPSVNIGNRIKDPDINLLRASNADIAIEYGVGLDLFYPLFKFAPELRFSHGLTNLRQPGTDVYSRSLQSMRSHTITLYLNFE